MPDEFASRADRLRAIQIIKDADADLMTAGVVVWRIQPADGARTAVVSYEDRAGHGLPAHLLEALADFPEGRVEVAVERDVVDPALGRPVVIQRRFETATTPCARTASRSAGRDSGAAAASAYSSAVDLLQVTIRPGCTPTSKAGDRPGPKW